MDESSGRMKFEIPDGKPFDVVGLGLNAVDELYLVSNYPERNTKARIQRMDRQGGGQVATAMVALGTWGARVRYIGKMGDDERGRFSLESIRSAGIDTSCVTIEPGATTQYGVIIVDGESGERTILWDRDDRLMYSEGQLDPDAVCSGRILHLDGHDVKATLKAIAWAKERGAPTVIDVDKIEEGTTEMIRDVDFLITSSTFPVRYTGIERPEDALIALSEEARGFTAMTLGAEGALAVCPDGLYHSPGFEVPVVDTTGAGDVFHAGFVFGLVSGWDLKRIMAFANAVAAIKCAKMGGRAGIPELSHALDFVSKRSNVWKETNE